MKKTTVNTNQKTEKKRKLIIVSIIAIALFLLAIFSTLAYLTSTTNTLDNVMTAGNITATLDEQKVDPYGDPTKVEQPGRVDDGQSYTLLSGHTYTKDPQIHVAAGSESCYVYMIIDDELIKTNSKVYGTNKSPEVQMTGKEATKWTLLTGVGLPEGKTGKVYAYNSVIPKDTTKVQDAKGFENFTLSSSLTNDQITALDGKHIIVNGAAIQSDGFDSAEAAWKAVYGEEAWKPLMVDGVKYYPVLDGITKGAIFGAGDSPKTATQLTATGTGGAYTMKDVADAAYKGTLYYKGSGVKAVRSIGPVSYNSVWDTTGATYTTPYHATTVKDDFKNTYLKKEGETFVESVCTLDTDPQWTTTSPYYPQEQGKDVSSNINGVPLQTVQTSYNPYNSGSLKYDDGLGAPYGYFWSCVANNSSNAYFWNCDGGGYWNDRDRDNSLSICVLVSRAFN